MGNAASNPTAALTMQVHVVPGVVHGETPAFRHLSAAERLTDEFNGVRTLYDNFQRGVSISEHEPCMGFREQRPDGSLGEYRWLTYREVADAATRIGSGLLAEGVRPRDFVGLYSRNCCEWVMAEQACNQYSMVTVPMYDTLGPDTAMYIVNETQMATVVCSGDKTASLLSLAPHCPSLRLIVQYEAVTPDLAQRAKDAGVRLLGLAELGAHVEPAAPIPPRPDDLATVCYTSGTTGNPKGAVITHNNFLATLGGVRKLGLELHGGDVHISYLPLAHCFERVVEGCVWHHGARVGFFSGDVTRLLEDVQALQPTLFPSVPRLFNRVFDKIMGGVREAGGVKKMLFETALSAKLRNLPSGQRTHAVWDRLVFGKIRQLLGGRVRLMITGAAPISAEVKNFLQVAFGCPVCEGYGLTETCAGGTFTPPEMVAQGHVGLPVPCVELKLVDVPEMQYLSTDKPCPRGEICMRGPNVFQGYYKQEDKTREAIDAQGWFHSGDVGRWNPDGTVSIIDRKKNIFKLAQGEYVAAEKIENVYMRSPLIAQAFVYGDSLQVHLVAVLVPDPEAVATWAQARGIPSPTDMAALCRTPELKQAILESMRQVEEDAKLHGFEKVKAIYLEPEPFSVENDMLTPTFKLKRPQCKARYETHIRDMYASLQ